MSNPRFTEEQIHAITRRLRQDYASHHARLKVRRMLVEMATDAFMPGNGTGTNVPAPFNKSTLIIQTMIGEVVKAVQQYQSMIAANMPSVKVTPILVDRTEATQKVKTAAGEQERLWSALFEAVNLRGLQQQAAWSQAWGRAGYYFTLPRDKAWGMPERRYYDDMSESELRVLKDAGKVTPEPIAKPDGAMAYAESGGEFMDRRKRHAQQRAIAARSMFTMNEFPPDVVYPWYDMDGMKGGLIQLQVPAMDCGQGTDYARMHHSLTGSQEELGKYGLYFDATQKRIRGGVTLGSERDVHDVRTFTFNIFATRDEVYFLISNSDDSLGTLVAYIDHGAGFCPIVPIPAYITDSMRPGGQYSSPMEAVFAKAPGINQLETFASNIVAVNSIPRWVIEKQDGSLSTDPQTGDPMVMTSESTIGLDPKDAQVIGGKAVQLVINGEMLMKLLEFYTAELQRDLPSPAATGQDGNDGTAWGMRQSIEQALAVLRPPVDNHAIGIKQIVQNLWIPWLRQAKNEGVDSIFALQLKTASGDSGAAMQMIEVDPDALIDAIYVTQSSDTAQAKVIKQQSGIEALQAGVETLEGYFEKYTDEQDPQLAVRKIDAYKVAQAVLYGDTTQIAPGSVLADVVKLARGELSQQMMSDPRMALATAAQMAAQANAQAQQMTASTVAGQPDGGNVAAAAGLVQPGMGMSPTLESQPTGTAVAPTPAAVA